MRNFIGVICILEYIYIYIISRFSDGGLLNVGGILYTLG